jgi:hypothetical protein
MKRILAASAACAFLAGCASPAASIKPSYVSTVAYQGLSCKQLATEAEVLSSRAAEAYGAQDQKAAGDAIAVGVAMVVFWPAAFLIGGDGAQATEVARLKGEMEAIEAASRRKGCGIVFKRPEPTAKPNTDAR